jgi:hypothetical protein
MAGRTPVKVKSYVTGAGSNLRKATGLPFDAYNAATPLKIPARSVTTAVYELESASNGAPTAVGATGAAEGGALHIYPNPVDASQSITVTLPAGARGGRLTFSFYSLTGQLMHEESREAMDEQATLRLPQHLAGGIYVLKAQLDGKVYQGKFFVVNNG